MTRFDRITEGEREKALLEKLRAGVVTADNVEEHCLPFFLKVQIQTDSRSLPAAPLHHAFNDR